MWNKFAVFALAVCAGLYANCALVVNEVCYDNSIVADETVDKSSDWIELYNSGPSSVNILNYGLGDTYPYDEAKGVRFPNYTIPSGGYLVVFASSDLAEYTAWTNAPDIAVVPANTTWRYSAPAIAPVATWNAKTFNDAAWASGIAPFGYNDPKQNMDCATVLSYGGNPANRYPSAYFRKTFNVINPSVVTGLVVSARINDGMVLYLNGVEVMRQNMPEGTISHTTMALMPEPSTLWTNVLLSATGLMQGSNVMAVEVHQAAFSSVDLIMDMTVTALVNEQVPLVHGQFGLTKTGENVHLFDSVLTRIHKFDSPGYEIGKNQSYGLATDGVAGTYTVYNLPTPGLPNQSNNQKFQTTLTSQQPTFSVPPGVYLANQSVVLNTATAGYKIYYTLDGSDPLYSTSFVYGGTPVTVIAQTPVTSGLSWLRTAPVEITNGVPTAAWQTPVGSVAKAVVLRAVAVLGTACSTETRGTYFIGTQFTNRVLPVVSLITDTNNLFGFTSGIYAPGKYYADSPEGYGSNKWGKPYANYHQDSDVQAWERPVQIELFETNQTTAAFSHMLGVTMHGGGTRAIPQKALYLQARLGEYGTDLVNYKLFPEEAATSYKRFLLRCSGNDWYGPDSAGIATMMKDAVFHRIAKGLDLSGMAYRPAVAYINGEYWGIHNLRESFDKHYPATRYGLEADNVDLLMHEEDPLDNDKVKITRIDGDKNCDEDYEALIDWIQEHPLSQDANYQSVQTWIDVTNHADYIIAETFFANTDWPINNCDFWRAHTNQVATCGKYGDTRWRWMLYDLDVAGARGADFDMLAYLSDNEMTGGSEPAFLINQLWANMSFRNYFVTRYANLLNTTFRPEHTANVIAQAANVIAPEVENHFRRWGRSFTQTQWRQTVTNVLEQYTAARHEASWNHLDAFFSLGGIGTLTVCNYNAAGIGGSFIINDIAITTDTEGVTNRVAWSGTFFRSLPVSVQAVPDAGYVFDRWVATTVTNPVTSLFVGANPITLTGRFRRSDAPLYRVFFDAQGGVVDPTNKVVAYEASYGVLPEPSRAGYAFGGWWTEPVDAGMQVTADSMVTATADHTLYAKWSANGCKVTFDPQGGTVNPANKTVTFDAHYGELPEPSRVGYSFGGWWTELDGTATHVTENSTVTIMSDHTLYAKWSANGFTVTFDAQGGVVSPANKPVTYGTPYGVLPTPSRTGYVFGGWQTSTNGVVFGISSNSVVSVAANHTLAATWTANNYTVTFDAQEGTVTPTGKSVTFGNSYGTLPTPSRIGHAFGGWWTEPGGTGIQVVGSTTVLTAANHTLYAKWTASGNTVIFDPQGGTVSPASKSVTFGTLYGTLPTPSRMGYAFSGWWTAPGGAGTRVTENSTITATSDHTLYALWAANGYTVAFDPRGGTVNPTNKTVTFDAPYGELPEPLRTGYTFGGWETSTNGIVFGVYSNSIVLTAADHTLDATWMTNTYSVVFDAQGGTVAPTNKIVTFDTAYGDLPETWRIGYAFGGWWTEPDGAGAQVTGDSIMSNAAGHTLYAKWTATDNIVTFDPQGGTVAPTSKPLTFGTPYGVLPSPSRNGYTFGGWWTAPDGVGTHVTETSFVTAVADHTLYALWTANSYVVSFDAQGGTVSSTSESVIFGTLYGAMPTPSREGHTFGGWSTELGGAGIQVVGDTIVTTAANHTLYATWVANAYTLIFNAQGGTVNLTSKPVTFDNLYGTLPTPSRMGYAFSGWWTVPGGAGTRVTENSTVTATSDHTLYALWAANGFIVAFDPLGGTVNPTNKTVTFDAPYGELPAPLRTGYTFGGWETSTNGIVFGVSSNSIVSIAADHTLDAKWMTNTYSVVFDAQGGTVVPTNKIATFDTAYGDLPEPYRTGHAFDGWWTEPDGAGIQVTGDSIMTNAAGHTLYAKWTATDNIVTFDPQEGTVAPTSKPVTFGTPYGALPSPSRAGHAFGGWWTAPGGVGTHVNGTSLVTAIVDHTLYALWTANSYVVSLDAQGGTVSPTSESVIFGTLYGAMPTPSRDGHAFGGWWTAPGGAGMRVTENSILTTASDHALYANWTANSYTVSFDAQGGTVSPTSGYVIFGTLYGAMPTPSRTGYIFGGWWTVPGGAGMCVTENSTVTSASDHMLYANWTASGLTVTFDAQGGAVSPTNKPVTYDAFYGVLPAPSRTGYVFGGWQTSTNGVVFGVSSNSVVFIATNHTLAAVWTANGFTVTFDPQGGAVNPSSKDVTFDAAYGNLPNPTWTGHTFMGWLASTNGTAFGVSSNSVVSIAADHTLAATWKTNSYTITFDAQGGTVSPASTRVVYGQTYGALPMPILPAPIRVDYVFGGWFTGANGTGLVVAEGTAVTLDVDHTLYAKWTAEPYVCGPDADVPLMTKGQYVGYFYSEAPFADTESSAVRGMFSMTLTKTNGALTAKAILQNGPRNFTAKTWDAEEAADGTKHVSLTIRTGETLVLHVREHRLWGSLSGGSLGSETFSLEGSRNRFADSKDAGAQADLATYKGYYTVALPLFDVVPTGAALVSPAGSGYLTLTVGTSGKVLIAGRLADGTSFSQSSTLILFDGCGPQACVPLFAPLYSLKGWTGGLLWFTPGGKGAVVTDRDLGWFLRWEKPSTLADGLSALLDTAGGYYSTVPALAAHYLLTADTNTVPYYYTGGSADLQTNALPDGINVLLNGKKLVITRGTRPLLAAGVYDYLAENSAMATFTFTSKTGLFKGNFNLYYDYLLKGRLQHKSVSVPYLGIFTPVRAAAFDEQPAGQGYYLVPDTDPLWRTSRLKRSYRITFDEVP